MGLFKTLALSIVTLASMNSYANSYIKCGVTADFDTFEVTGYELELSSESDKYSGAVGKSWNMKLGDESSNWEDILKTAPNTSARFYNEGNDTVVEIIVEADQSANGPVAENFKIDVAFNFMMLADKY